MGAGYGENACSNNLYARLIGALNLFFLSSLIALDRPLSILITVQQEEGRFSLPIHGMGIGSR